MAQIIAKFGFLKGKSRGGYAKYIATREGVEKLDESLRGRPVTQAQQEFIQKLLEDFPDSKELWEYEDYKKSPTLGSASEFISATIELHAGEVMNRSGYLKYMGTRPRVEKQGSHGLFSYAGEPISLNKVAQEMDTHRGNIWTAIYSLRREDAQRLGFDTAARWRDLLRSQAVTLAEGLKIPPTHLKWYAAFHNEGHHPHVHLIAYSTKPGEGFLTKQGMDIIRSALAQEIFRQDLVSVYEQQTAHRDELRRTSREKVAGLVQQISGGACENPKLESMLRELTGKLSNVKGKKVYGYLRPELKALVNQIVDELAKDSRIAQLYDLWYRDKQAARNVYDERPIERIPLCQNPDFKPIRNAVVQAAVELDVEQRQTQNQNYTPPLLPMATRLLRQVGQIFRQQFQIDPPVARLVDAKLRRKIAEKKLPMGKNSKCDWRDTHHQTTTLSGGPHRPGGPAPRPGRNPEEAGQRVGMEIPRRAGHHPGPPVVRPVHPEGRGCRGLLPLLLRGVGGTGGGHAAELLRPRSGEAARPFSACVLPSKAGGTETVGDSFGEWKYEAGVRLPVPDQGHCPGGGVRLCPERAYL